MTNDFRISERIVVSAHSGDRLVTEFYDGDDLAFDIRPHEYNDLPSFDALVVSSKIMYLESITSSR